jgi:uncharacterized protein YraI
MDLLTFLNKEYMTRLNKILFSTRTMTVLLLLFGISMAVATYVENNYDTATASCRGGPADAHPTTARARR